MKIQILNSFKGDDVRDIDTSQPEGKGTAAKLIADLLRTGSALFLEKVINGETYTYRVSGYDEVRDKIKLTLAQDETPPQGAIVPKKRGRYKTRGQQRLARTALVESNAGQIVSVAPVSGGSGRQAKKKRREAWAARTSPPAPPELTWEGIRYGVAKICEERGWHHGCPMPSATDQGHRLIVARGAPLRDSAPLGIVDFNMRPNVHVCSNADVNEDPLILVNSWRPTPVKVSIYRDSKGTVKLQMPEAHIRLKMLVDTMVVRAGAVDAATELTAMMSLRLKINDKQWGCYLLNGMFPETSPRSGVTYILRKGLPTIALRERMQDDGKIHRNFLAALCLHPMAYYEATFAGSQPPTDEVIGHLMMIRADEHRFWKKAGQHPIDEPAAAI